MKRTAFFISIFLILSLISGCCTVVTRDYQVEALGNQQNPEAKDVVRDDISDVVRSARIMQISDFHSNDFGKNEEGLLSKVRKINPDVILLTGDIFDSTMKGDKPLENVDILLSGIRFSYPTCPMYYVSGNHEYDFENIQDCYDVLQKYDVVILHDRSEVLEIRGLTLIFSGIFDPYDDLPENTNWWGDQKEKYRERVRLVAEGAELIESGLSNAGVSSADVLSAASDNSTADNSSAAQKSAVISVLVAHRPEYIKDYIKYDFDLIFAGHAHGGQWRLPFINGLYSPGEGAFPKFAGGRYDFYQAELTKKHVDVLDDEGCVFVVSRGLSYQRPKTIRVFNSPELVAVDILY